jgi:hypothetical protein
MANPSFGYVLEPPRVGQANSPFTATPDCGSYTVADRAAFAATYGTDESDPGRREYLVLALKDGDLYDASFGWTRNDALQRFGFASRDGRFRPLPGGPRLSLGPLPSTANVDRLVVPPPVVSLAEAPARLSVGSIGSGATLTLSPVPTEADFTPALPSGSAQVSLETGALNWSPVDLATLEGELVFFQSQAFAGIDTSGRVGALGAPLFLTPFPAPGQRPLVRIGFGLWLADAEVADDASLGAPTAGTFAWSRATGRLRFSATDEALYPSAPVYYDGVLFQRGLTLPRQTIGTVSAPTTIANLPDPGGDLVFRAGSKQFAETIRVPDFAGPLPKAGQVQVTPVGAVRLASADATTGAPLTVLFGDLPLEDGLSFRFFRTPVDLTATNPGAKDVAAYYPVEGSILADPMIGSPLFTLPITPLDDSSYPFVVRVEQGTGSFVGTLPRLDVPSPPAGLGFVLNLEAGELALAVRKEGVIVSFSTPTGALPLPDALLFSQGLFLELDRGSGFSPLALEEDAVVDLPGGLVSFVTRVGEPSAEGVASLAGATLTDPTVTFTPLSGDRVLIASGPSAGLYDVTGGGGSTLTVSPPFPAPDPAASYELRNGEEVLADRFFVPVSLADPGLVVERLRGATVTTLVERKDYRLDPLRGLFQLTERLLANDELRITYAPVGADGVALPSRTERSSFLVRRETATHPSPGSTATFNPLGREVATNPPPAVYRGGRPQRSEQVAIDGSTITFLPDRQVTDALPHGSSLDPSERVAIDYYVYGALGGETTTRVLLPPVRYATPQIRSGDAYVDIPGDRTASFPTGCALRVDGEAVYLLAGSVFDSVTGATRITLGYGQTFRDDVSPRALHVTSAPVLPFDYFVLDAAGYEPVPRGMNRLRLSGDRTTAYTPGTLVAFVVGADVDTYLVSGSSFDPEAGVTEVVWTSSAARQYDVATLRRSVRPIFEEGVTVVRSSRVPLPGRSVVVVRRNGGFPGVVLSTPVDYAIDASGQVTLVEPLASGESLTIFYAGYAIVPSGTLRASYSSAVVPSASNGLLGQRLVADFTVFSPDSFFARVETLTNYRGEVTKKYQEAAKAGSPSGGPVTSNAANPKLFEQGAPSIFFEEGALRNEDIIARETLLTYHRSVEALEDALEAFDGRTVGDADGPFRFDGLLTNPARATMASATNQIDDLVLVSPLPAPGRYLRAYEASPISRLYATRRAVRGLTTGASETDDPVFDLGVKNVTKVHSIARRPPRALVTAPADVVLTTLSVDQTAGGDLAPDGVTPLLRPAFAVGMKIFVPGYATGPFTLTSVGPTSLSFTPALPGPVPAGATVTLSAADTSYRKTYRPDFDLGLDPEGGQLLYVEPYPPYDGSSPDVPSDLQIHPPASGELLDATFTHANARTAPEKIPALFGQPLTDDGDQAVPFLVGGGEASLLSAAQVMATDLETATDAPFVGEGTLNVARTTIVLTSGTFPSPVPKVNDLARILVGANAGSPFARVLVATATSITVETPFTFAETAPVRFTVTSAPSLVEASPGGPMSHPQADELDDPSANFLSAGVAPGHTLVITSAPDEGARYQIVEVNPSSILVAPPFTSLTGGRGYRIVRALPTYGGLDAFTAPLADLASVVGEEIDALDAFLGEASGVSQATLDALTAVREEAAAFLVQVLSFASAVGDPVSAGGAYARGVTGESLAAWADALVERSTALPTSVAAVEASLTSTDRLYDVRYAWVDARTNLESGILPRIALAAAQRAKKADEIRNQLIKLLSL